MKEDATVLQLFDLSEKTALITEYLGFNDQYVW